MAETMNFSNWKAVERALRFRVETEYILNL